MSAFVVGEEHINYLLNAAFAFNRGAGTYWTSLGSDSEEPRKIGELTIDNASEIGAMLWRENYASVNARYNASGEAPTFRFSWQPTKRYDPVQVLKALSCYEYQSCEHRGWWSSSARAFCESLRHDAISKLPGYEDAAWTVA